MDSTFKLPPLDQLGFGLHFCPKMMLSEYKNGVWSELNLSELHALNLHPASKTLHYAQEIFEGLKAFKHGEDLLLFRPEENIKRMTRSAQIMAMPPFPEDKFLSGIKKLVSECREWVPEEPGALYLRPTMIASTPALGVATAKDFIFYVLASPVGGYFGATKSSEPAKVSLWVTNEHVRAVAGGIGSAKTGANYAASLRAVSRAKEMGYENVLFLDALKKDNFEELSGMNVFVVEGGVLKTPPVKDTILRGVTRASILEIARELKIPAVEEELPWSRIRSGLSSSDASKYVSEIFACGTGASITAVCELGWQESKFKVANADSGPITRKLFKYLLDIQYGRQKPLHENWLQKC